MGYSSWGHKESDTTEELIHTHTHTHTQFAVGFITFYAVVPREKPHTGAAAREQPRDSPVIER